MRRTVAELREETKRQDGCQKGRWRVEREKEWRHPRRAEDSFGFIEEEAGTFNWNPDVEPETGKPIYGPGRKDRENSF